MKVEFDVLIIGGGMVGASLACALSPLKLKTGIIERCTTDAEQQPSFDDRSIAMAYGTKKIFRAIGIWDNLVDVISPIRKIHISERGNFGATRLDCKQLAVDALGYVVESRDMGRVLRARLQDSKQIEVISPADVKDVIILDDHAELVIQVGEQTRILTSTLVIAADGSQSFTRGQLNIPVKTLEYGQTALISNVSMSSDHHNIAYERFTPTGPLALLPMQPADIQGKACPRCSLVWTLRDDQIDEVMALADDEFLSRLQETFGRRLGEFIHVGSRHAYPLRLIRASEHVQSRIALIGNAAHTLHPVAGQGYNLGIRDVAVLADVIASALRAGRDIGDIQVLGEYAKWRQRDHNNVITFTDSLIRIFTNPLFPVKVARGLALTALDFFPVVKNGMARRTMGLSGYLPRLARGLPVSVK
ncbi:MAG TPA: 2-octaprenyl-6-methoxyphenyl hydroxylase [Gammaproteobacteria bacterium]|nr:2-octaprenyl-6-methoxyphenyl hydroxylase [Gammaproteobacteria bacterium]